MRTPKIVLIACLLMLPLAVRAAEAPTLETVLTEIQAKSEKVKSFASDMEMEMNMAGMKMSFGGKAQGKDKLMIMTMNMNVAGQSMAMRSVIDKDGIMWMDMDMMGQKQVMKMDMSKLKEMGEKMLPGMGPGGQLGGANSDPRKSFEQYRKMFDLTLEKPEQIDGVDVYVLSGKIKPEQLKTLEGMAANGVDMMAMMGASKLKYGMADGFPRSVEMLGTDGTPWMTQSYKNVKLNVPMLDADFVYTPPDGVQVMDMSQMMTAAVDQATGGKTGTADKATDGGDGVHNTKLKVGDTAPDFEGPSPAGGKINLSAYKGKVVLLDFWATWCGPCIHELPNMASLYKDSHPKGLEVISISVDDDLPAYEGFLKEHPEMAWKQVFDRKGFDGPIPTLYGVDAIPFTLLLDKDGRILAKDLVGDGLKAAVEKALGGKK